MKIEVNTHEKNMIRFAAEHPEVLVMSADLGSSCEVKKFRQTYPDRYLTMSRTCAPGQPACAVKATVRSCIPLRYSCIAASSISWK